VFEGSWVAFRWPTLVCMLASGLTAVYAVRLFNRVGFGRLDNDRADWLNTTWPERFPAVVLAGLIVLAGIWPATITGFSEASVTALALRHTNLAFTASAAGAASTAAELIA
jgi:NAD(P)H-quinone oxidoreductase subunit 4